MRDGPTRQRLSGFMFLMVNGRAQPVARVGLWITRARSRVLVLLAILLAAHAGSADAAEGTFIPIDLDTLGGTRSIAHAVNDSGQVAGGREPVAGGGSTHAFLWTAVGGMVDLGSLGGAFSDAAGRPGPPGAINASGQVVGESDTAGGSRHAFSWTAAGGMIDLGTLGGAYSAATAVNDSGQVVGESDPADGNRHRHAFSCTAAGGMVDLGTLLGGPRSTATAVNGSGQVVGVGVITDDASSFHAFLWTGAGGMVDLGTLGATSSASAVNDSGQVVGVWTPSSGSSRAFSWTVTGGMVDLGTLGGTFASATAINASGQVVGSSGASSDNQLLFDAFLWTAAGGMVGLGNLGGVGPVFGVPGSFARAINASGQVVGGSFAADSALHAFSWTAAGGMIDLGTLGGLFSDATAINASGQIVGYSDTAEAPGIYHAVLWQPIANLGCKKTLAGCNLSGVNLAGAYLYSAGLRGTNLKHANLARANLSGADLKGANMKGANLTNANLVGADLKGANVKDVIWSTTICPDGTNSDNNGGTCVGHL